MILACDGFWDAIPPQKAVNTVHALLGKIRNRKGFSAPDPRSGQEALMQQHPTTQDLEIVAKNLVRYARKKGSRDNISVIVVPLNLL